MESGAAQGEAPVGVIFRDASGNYYAIPGKELVGFQLPPDSRPAVEGFLDGSEPISLPHFTTEHPAHALHTTRRSDELWLILS
jgi:hypothetical protein